MKAVTKALSIVIFTFLLFIVYNSYAAASILFRVHDTSANRMPATEVENASNPLNNPNVIWHTTTNGKHGLTWDGSKMQEGNQMPQKLKKLFNNNRLLTHPSEQLSINENGHRTTYKTTNVPAYKPMPRESDIQPVRDSNFSIGKEVIRAFYMILAIEDQQKRMNKYFDFLSKLPVPIQKYFLRHTPFTLEKINEEE